MPRGDGTGPEGKGPKTGRGAGRCTGDPVPKDRNEEAPRPFLRRDNRGRRR